jgi:prevent-host-death family protein
MATVGSYEAKTQLSRLLKRTARGEHITITKHGVSVAMLVPACSLKKTDMSVVIEEIRQFRKKHTLAKASLKEMIEEGRRY